MDSTEVEKEIRETTEAYHQRKFTDEEWAAMWTDLLLYAEYGPRKEYDFR